MDPVTTAMERAEFLGMLADIMFEDTDSETFFALEDVISTDLIQNTSSEQIAKNVEKVYGNGNNSSNDKKGDNKSDEKKDGEKKDENQKGKLTLGQRLNNVYAYIEEAFKRMWTSMRETMTALTAEGKNYKDALKKMTKGKKPDYNIHIRNYFYNDSVIDNMPQVTTNVFMEYYNAMEKAMAEWKRYDEQENYTDDSFKNKLDEFDKSTVGGLNLSTDVYKILANKFLGNTPNELNGGGELYEALRKHFHGGKDEPEEYTLDHKRDELTKAVDIINTYDKTCTTLNNGCNALKQNVDNAKNKASQFSTNTNKNCADFVKRLQAYSKAIAFLMNLYPFAASLVKERVVNSYNLIKSAYKGVT